LPRWRASPRPVAGVRACPLARRAGGRQVGGVRGRAGGPAPERQGRDPRGPRARRPVPAWASGCSIHSAHQFDTSLEHFRRLLFLIENTPTSTARQARVALAWRGGHRAEGRPADPVPHPDEGRRPRVLRRLPGVERGDGAARVGDGRAAADAVGPAEPAGLVHGVAGRPGGPRARRRVGRVRERAQGRRSRRSPTSSIRSTPTTPDDVTEDEATDPEAWAQANPGLGIRITPSTSREQRSMDARTFAVERLGVGDWPGRTGWSTARSAARHLGRTCSTPIPSRRTRSASRST
jgi:hypothetical protein